MEFVLFIYVVFFFSSCVALPIVCPSMICVSDVLDLSLVSKRFGFWPHITHVIVLTFKEIKHLSDYRTVGLKVGPRYCFMCVFFPLYNLVLF